MMDTDGRSTEFESNNILRNFCEIFALIKHFEVKIKHYYSKTFLKLYSNVYIICTITTLILYIEMK